VLLGMSGRNFRRLIVRYDKDSEEGLRDRWLGRPSPRRVPAAELSRMQMLYQERYRNFTVKHLTSSCSSGTITRLTTR
jgi:hypothetical protein